MTKKSTYRVKGWHVLAAMIAFFGIVIGVNVTFIIKATGTFPGMSVQHPYTKGLRYNQTIAQRQQAEREGWNSTLVLNDDAALVVQISNNDGPVDGLAVSVHLFWPGLPKEDRQLDLLPSGPGEYRIMLDKASLPERKMAFEGVAVRRADEWMFPFRGRL
jgi:nitrogen fixation protein FixH